MSAMTWPARSVTFEFSHETVGDERFSPMIDEAFAEYRAAIRTDKIDEMADFRASNGTLIRVSASPT